MVRAYVRANDSVKVWIKLNDNFLLLQQIDKIITKQFFYMTQNSKYKF